MEQSTPTILISQGMIGIQMTGGETDQRTPGKKIQMVLEIRHMRQFGREDRMMKTEIVLKIVLSATKLKVRMT